MNQDIAYICPSFLQTLKSSKSQESWEEFYLLYGTLIQSTIRRMIKNEEDVKDICQEVKVHIWRRIHSYKPGAAKFISWLKLVIKNKVLDILKQRQRKSLEFKEQWAYQVELIGNSGEIELRQWQHSVLEEALNKLSRQVSSIYVEFIDLYISGLTIPDICQRLRIKKSHAYQIKKRMQDKLQKEIVKVRI